MKTDRFVRKHYLCTCPDLTYENFDTIDRSKCEGGEKAHPVVTKSMMDKMIEAFKRPNYFD